MVLDRDTVDRTTAEHIRHLAERGRVTDEQKRRIRKMHERIARKVDAKRR